MSIEKKFDILEREILKASQRIKELYRQNIELKGKIKVYEEREAHLLREIESLKKNGINNEIKKRLIKISDIIEKELKK